MLPVIFLPSCLTSLLILRNTWKCIMPLLQGQALLSNIRKLILMLTGMQQIVTVIPILIWLIIILILLRLSITTCLYQAAQKKALSIFPLDTLTRMLCCPCIILNDTIHYSIIPTR